MPLFRLAKESLFINPLPMSDLELAVQLDKVFRPEVERMLYFNRGQDRVVKGIEAGILKYGRPVIFETGDRINIGIEGFDGSQGLFCLERVTPTRRLVGLMLFLRSDEETLSLVHVAIAESCTLNKRQSKASLLFFLVDELQAIARRIRGIRRIELIYGPDRSRYLRVRS